MSKQSAYFRVSDLSGRHDVKSVKNALAALPGVLSVSVNPETGRVAVDYDSTGIDRGVIQEHMEELGVQPRLIQNDSHIV